ncbi:hypothetical protein PGT21_036497 [Puccinia graminis f. sp. tritici]|uniref:Uncharacterized protein n=1 Tax=Puccinia graminis f. sp. tritici TaxID=56615 RepID=A0A5B0QRA8_PUCGR|nr:hypothetical protein PGT21_036497 [Puccinia graminis f. sp. tritici]
MMHRLGEVGNAPIPPYNPMYTENFVRNRQKIAAPGPYVGGPSMKPPTPPRMDRLASPEQQKKIDDILANYESGFSYQLTKEGQFIKLPKANCDPKHYCGMVDVFDEDGALLHKTGCCHWNWSILSFKANNAAELAITDTITGLLCGSGLKISYLKNKLRALLGNGPKR